jgi:hypothetical protein
LSFRKIVPIALLMGLAPLNAMTGAPVVNMRPTADPIVSGQQSDRISVLTYNVHGLPWPLAGNRETAFISIERRLTDLRAKGAKPHIMVLQEAFTDRAKQIGKNSGYAYFADGPGRDDPPKATTASAEDEFLEDGSAQKDETEGKWTGSGLQVFSDYPIFRVKRMAF